MVFALDNAAIPHDLFNVAAGVPQTRPNQWRGDAPPFSLCVIYFTATLIEFQSFFDASSGAIHLSAHGPTHLKNCQKNKKTEHANTNC